jgi:PAS domain S-box-containing protein
MEETIRILMAEDMVVEARLAEREILKSIKSCAFKRVETREDFIEAVLDFHPDLVITDYRMPRFDGMTALKLSVELAPQIPVIVLTGAINEDTAVECMKAGAVDYVIKEHVKRLGQAVIHALEQKQIREERRMAEEALREREVLYRTLVETLPDAITVTDILGNITYVSAATLQFYGYDSESEVLGVNFTTWLHPGLLEKGVEAFRHVIGGGSVRNLELLLFKKDRSEIYCEVSASCLKDAQSKPTGVVIIVRNISERKLADLALRESEARYRTRTAELETLFTISTLLSQARNENDMLNVVLHEAQRILGADSSAILLLDAKKENFVITHAKGSLKSNIGMSFRTDQESISGQVLISGQPYMSSDYSLDTHRVREESLSDSTRNIGFATFVPIQSEDEILGVLMISHLKDSHFDLFGHEDTRLLSAIGEIAGNALRRVRLFEDLQTSNSQITMAYEDTIDALSRALDLRDKDTEGHTRRVIELTLSLACKVGMNDAQLVHIRRGAYLHDMGKIGIPDAILLKPGPLTDEEWEIMRRHPQYTYDMLSHIDYLVPALDIPYFHHEKWDGSGYPRRLKGDEIPLAARLFAIVDVWDALTSERPYRSAWSKEKAIRYIREQSGRHFDPCIVDLFLEII